ncbi:5-formyltetrahydrofolate cyclo-ligase [Phytomonospora endophytica]|uniref:5-formyltetrahydrofolate cyclo-ligase n=1 Tax=Phytomonospora endophytica TaxID=714109 RepID=A0A841FUR0_9ACTN|nr:5-formyltetrahydrofolate cyclo-ligase [Phytomonospora endophytica]GIG70918.1 5-formyltetrahydrofolate cyclo-ligase [Phytomonospora endophytica]
MAADEAIRAVLAATLPVLAEPGSTVAAYVPMAGEPGGDGLPDFLTALGHRVLLPVFRADFDLDWIAYTGVLSAGALRGLREPAGTGSREAVTEAAVLLVPALAVGADGTRLGRGGGSYDRALARVAPSTPVIALLDDGEFVDEVPGEDHDRGVTGIITPRGWYATPG